MRPKTTMKENTFTHIFPCGVRFAFKRTKSQVAYSALSIKSGTRNEQSDLSGIAHLTEHMLFKGTLKRTPQEITDRLEKLGGDLNAYTTKEETVLYATVLKEDASKAVDLLFELAFTSTFPQEELDKERHVVIDEINMYKDSPSECIFDNFEELLFEGHELSRQILGDARSLRKINSSDLKRYVSENFKPERMCISIVADITPQRALKLAENAIASYIPAEYTPKAETGHPATSGRKPSEVHFTKEIVKKNHQVNCIVGTTACSFYDEERMTLILLNNILGGPSSNSRLNQALREKNALVYSVDSSYGQFTDSGSVMIYFGCDKGNLEECLSLVHSEIARLRDKPLSASMLKAAKKQLLGQLAIASDNGESQALSIGKSMLVFGGVMPDEEVRSKINSITAEQLQLTAQKILAENRLSTLVYK